MSKDSEFVAKPKDHRLIRIWRYVLHRLFPKRQDPMNVSISVALGIFIGILPTWGFALLLTAAVLAILRLPKLPGLMSSFVAIPPTLPFFYTAGYQVGQIFLPVPDKKVHLIHELMTFNFSNFSEKFQWLFGIARPYFITFMIGTSIVALVTAVLGAILTWFIMNYRKKQYHASRRTILLAASTHPERKA